MALYKFCIIIIIIIIIIFLWLWQSMWAERSGKISRSSLSSIYDSAAHRSAPDPTTSRSAHAPLDFWTPLTAPLIWLFDPLRFAARPGIRGRGSGPQISLSKTQRPINFKIGTYLQDVVVVSWPNLVKVGQRFRSYGYIMYSCKMC